MNFDRSILSIVKNILQHTVYFGKMNSIISWLQFPTFLTLALNLLVLCDPSSQSIVQHGTSFSIRGSTSGHCLTSTHHTFHPDDGVFVGEVLTSECHRSPYQFWDAIHWPKTPENQFWFFPKGAPLNEITHLLTPDAVLPLQNSMHILYVARNTKDVQFQIRSVGLNKCIESHGLDFRITFEPCNVEKQEQRWTAVPFVNEDDGSSNSKDCLL